MILLSSILASICLAAPAHAQATTAGWHFRARGDDKGISIELIRDHEAPALDAIDIKFRVYRGIQPHFAAGPGSLLATGSAKSTEVGTGGPLGEVRVFQDHSDKLRPGTVYYYKFELFDSAGNAEPLVPDGLGSLAHEGELASAVTAPYPPLDIVFIGDSITEAGYLPRDKTPCAACAQAVELGPHARIVRFSNEGHSGHTTKDYLPGGNDFTNAEAAATHLSNEDPGTLVFSVMLGTNDSANTGPNGSPIDAAQYGTNLRSMIGTLLKDYPNSLIVLNRPTWYSPNTHNGASYEEDGLERLTTYFPVIDRLPRAFPRGRVFIGDTRGYSYFADHYLSSLRAENGRNGTFYLHPSASGAQDLGDLWAAAILRAIGE